MTARTRAGLVKFKPVERGSRVALVAPASAFDRTEFLKGVAELERLGFETTYDQGIFARETFVAGSVSHRTASFLAAWEDPDLRAVIAVRGGYGSVEILPHLDPGALQHGRHAFVGYSDLTSLHSFLNQRVGVTTVHGAMLDGRLAKGPAGYDERSFLASLSASPLGEWTAPSLEVLRPGEARGPMCGGTLVPLLASLGTPYAFDPPAGSVLFLEDVNERPYRLRRMLTQLRLSGLLAKTTALVFGEMSGCDESGGEPTARGTIAECLADYPGPVLFGFPSGHTATPLVSVPFGVEVRVVGSASPCVVFEEAAAG